MLRLGRRGSYTVTEVAELLQFHPDAVLYWLRVGELPARQTDQENDWVISSDDLVSFLRQGGDLLPTALASLN